MPQISFRNFSKILKSAMVQIRELSANEKIPFDLLLIADPELDSILQYIENALIFIAEWEINLVGCIVLGEMNSKKAEIKNIAVGEKFQNRGIGKLLISHAIQTAKSLGKKQLIISPADTSTGPLYLYKKMGFKIVETEKDYFPKHYKNPIFENGIQCVDRIVLGVML